ncbi:MAG: galactokinase family protein [bacterium]|nr:galactokinase family protein [bacterium]
MKNTKQLIAEFDRQEYDNLLLDIYVDPKVLNYQRTRYIKAIKEFETLYGESSVDIYSAPGRTEVGGNHTDHQHGEVLAAAVNLDIIAVVGKNAEEKIKIVSDDIDIPAIAVGDYRKRVEEANTSITLVRGVCNCLEERGYLVGGMNIFMTSDVLGGSGLSSSAAFEVVLGTAISGMYNQMQISPILIAQAGQYAENVYFDKLSGLMDQMASSVGSLVHIDFADNENPKIDKVAIDFEQFDHSLCIVDTKGSHADLSGEYSAIPIDMKKVAAYFGKEYLTQVSEMDFYKEIPKIREIVGDRCVLRAIHFYDDNRRVREEVEALRSNQFARFKELISESGNSSYKYLQNVYANMDFENQSIPMALALSEKELGSNGVCRVHGGGFAGTIQVFIKNDAVDAYKATMEYYFGKGSCHVLKIRKYGGIRVIGG